MRNVFLGFVVAAFFGMALGSCQKRDDGIVRWAFWGNEERVRMTQEAVNVFQAANPDVRVNIEPAGGAGDHFNRVDIQIAGGNPPDVIQMGGNFPDYAMRGIILPLDDFIAGGIIDGAAIEKGVLDAGRHEGRLYGMATGIAVPALVYNRSLLERHGLPLPSERPVRTYDEFLGYLRELRAGLPSDVWPMMDFGFTGSGSTPFGYWLRYRGVDLFNTDTGSTEVTATVATQYFELWAQYRSLNLIPPATVSAEFPETSSATSALVAGRVAISFIVSTQLPGYQSAMTDGLELALMPGVASGTRPLWPQLSQVMTISRQSSNPEAAARVINFMINSPEAGRILQSDRGASASSTFRAGEIATPLQRIIDEYHDIAGPFISPEGPHLPNDTEFNSVSFLIHQQVAFGQLTPAQGGQQLFELITRLAGN